MLHIDNGRYSRLESIPLQNGGRYLFSRLLCIPNNHVKAVSPETNKNDLLLGQSTVSERVKILLKGVYASMKAFKKN